MKTVKPLKLGLLHKTYENGPETTFAVTALVYFHLSQPRTLFSEAGMWKTVAELLADVEPLDECMPKSRGEMLVSGFAFPPGGEGIACQVRARVGAIEKSLYAIGDRHWKRGGVASDPVPFSKMPITWERAFGGEGFDRNPRGRGVAPITDEDGNEVHPLPNIEPPKKRISSPTDKPTPAGFSALDVSWPQRMDKAGTYDQHWFDTRFPGYAADLDWTFFNQAPEDQQQEGFFRGDESIEVEHMHPDKPLLEGRLPGVAVRCFVNRATEGIELEEITMHIDTVRLVPHLERGIAIFRGILPVAEDDAHDVLQLLAGVEAMGEPKPRSHYVETLRLRMDKEKGPLFALRDRDLLPEGWAPAEAEEQSEELSEHAALTRSDNLLREAMNRQADRQVEQMREHMRAAGIDPDEHPLPEREPIEPPPTVDTLADYTEEKLRWAEEERARAEAEAEAMEERARELCAAHGLDWEAMVEKARRENAGPPTFSAEAELERLRDKVQLFRNIGTPHEEAEAQLADPELAAKLRNAEVQLRTIYRTQVQHFPGAAALEGDEAAEARRAFLAAVEAGESLAERDFSGVDLSGLDLRQAKLAGAWLESAKLQGSNLAGVDLTRTVLARADLSGADLSGATLTEANLGEALLAETEVAGAQCRGAVFVRAHLDRTDLTGADLTGANLLEAKFHRTRLDRATLAEGMFIQVDMTGVSAMGANLRQSHVIESTVDEGDFSRADLTGTNFVTVSGRGSSFEEAKLSNVRIVAESDFEGASFRGAVMKSCNLRGTKLAGANFRQADLDGSDLSECDLSGAQLELATAKESLLIRANLAQAQLGRINLMDAIVQKANIEGADFQGANLFRVDFAKIKGNDGTNFTGANMKNIRFVDRKGS